MDRVKRLGLAIAIWAVPFLPLACSQLARGDDPAPKPPAVRLPEPPAAPPAPLPAPDAPTALGPDELYVVDSDVELFVRAFPAGVLAVTPDAGPIRIRGKFAGEARTSSRTFKGPFVYIVEAARQGTADLILIPKGVADDKQILTRRLTTNTAPQPPPGPGPTPQPPPSDNPFGTTDDAFRVMIVYETGAVVPAGQHSALYGKTVREYLDKTCAAGPDGKTREWRIYDQNLDLSGEAKHWQAAMKLPRQSLPWVYAGKGKAGLSAPLPADPAATVALLKTIGGE